VKYPLCVSFLCTALLSMLCAPLSPCQLSAQIIGSSESDASLAQSPDRPAATSESQIDIPGPLRSFLRMAGISQKVSPEEVLPLVARNVVMHGYLNGRPTEFLVLLNRYVHQARELAALAGSDGIIHVSNCMDVKPLLGVLGYRLPPDCGQSRATLVTADAERAFLTIDSGFPLFALEETLRGHGAFTYSFSGSPVPVLFGEKYWITAYHEKNRGTSDLLDALLRDRELAQLYWALYGNDSQTRSSLERDLGLTKLLPFAAMLELYGSQICVRSGRLVVPGGTLAESSWKDLVGASPQAPKEFIPQLLKKDKGWLAAYFDALSRTSQAEQEHLTQDQRLKRFYNAFRSAAATSGDEAARFVFRPAPSLLLLVTRLQWESNGEPHVPGNLEVWKEIIQQKSGSKVIREWRKRAAGLQHNDQLLEAMFAFSQMETEVGPLQAYLLLSELDSVRPTDKRLSPQTVRLMANSFSEFGNQYLVFSEFPNLSDASISRFLRVAQDLSKIPNRTLRGNAMGIFQANVGLWQIVARQGQVGNAKLNDSWQKVIEPFAKISSSAQLFDAGRSSLQALALAVGGKPNISQDEMIELLAGPRQNVPESQRMHQEVANKIRAVMDAQRLVSLDTLLALGDGLEEIAGGTRSGAGDRLLALAGELREFEMPRPIFSNSEKTQWASGTYNNRHTELQMRTDLTKLLTLPHSTSQLQDARGDLASFLRDTLVGLNYAYYEPPGAQVLHNNPLFVRSHDFSGETVTGLERVWQAPRVFGEGSPVGGARLIGSLADLPYVLGEVEQDFIAPEHVQALIWKQLVPSLLTDATVPRWWGISRTELHGVRLYQQAGEELLIRAGSGEGDEELRSKVVNILSDRITTKKAAWLEQALQEQAGSGVISQMTPSETFYLAAQFRRRFPGEIETLGSAAKELANLERENPEDLSWERLSGDFGIPHPILTQSYARALLNVKPFPAMGGYCSRLMAESWDSNNLYWARLADEMGYSPVLLNRLVPELTRRMIEKIFATELEDWPAILRAMRETGDEFRASKIASLAAKEAGSHP
jgi:hypothetical protein